LIIVSESVITQLPLYSSLKVTVIVTGYCSLMSVISVMVYVLFCEHPEKAMKHRMIAKIANNIRFMFTPFLVVVVE